MAENSQREQILEAIKSKLLQLQWAKVVKRSRPSFDSLKSIPNTMFPFISLTGALPSGQPAKRDERNAYAKYTKFISTLRIDVVVFDFMYSNTEYDVLISNRADDLWAKIYEDPSFGNLLLSCLIEPEPVVGVWDPYLAFKMTVVGTYHHGIGGI